MGSTAIGPTRPAVGWHVPEAEPVIRRFLRLVVAAAGLLAAASAAAQVNRDFRSGPPGNFDYYMLALSWSPTFCAFEGSRKDREQCEPGRRLGFVVHGLWPQLERGRLEDCDAFTRAPSRMALEEAEGVFPSLGLARHEWREHGPCTGLSPAEYFRDTRRAFERLRIPERFRSPERDFRTSPREVERAFVEANPGLRADMISVSCRTGRLREIRICFERDLRGFRSCPRTGDGGCPIDELLVTGPQSLD